MHTLSVGTPSARSVFAYALFVMTTSMQVAAHYLGDEGDTVKADYSAINGVQVDSSPFIGFEIGPRVGACMTADA